MKRYLLDTHTFLWFVDNDPKLSAKAPGEIRNPNNEIFLSLISVWEIVIKVSIGKLSFSMPFESSLMFQLNTNGIQLLDLKLEHLTEALNLPLHHREPFDRLLIAQAISENLDFITVDSLFKPYPINIVW
jgi:PIN domain nuclease of toxin-antitoxin system